VKLIQGGAHHLDLRLPNDADPQDLKDARTMFATKIQGWITAYKPKSISETREIIE
jgi:hypothetical protein